MLSINQQALMESYLINSDSAWLLLLEIRISSLPDPIRVVRNTENITWNGQLWQAFPFELGEIGENSKGELPLVTLKVCNIDGTIQPYVDEAKGGVGGTVILRVVNSKVLNGTTAEIEEIFSVQNTLVDNNWITFELGGSAVINSRFPRRRILKDRCPYQYKGVECGATSALAECNKTLANCEERNNYPRFGGEPGIPVGGLYV